MSFVYLGTNGNKFKWLFLMIYFLKVIGPESNTTFEVVFLSRVEGLVESNLYIHTSKGLFKYYVSWEKIDGEK